MLNGGEQQEEEKVNGMGKYMGIYGYAWVWVCVGIYGYIQVCVDMYHPLPNKIETPALCRRQSEVSIKTKVLVSCKYSLHYPLNPIK